jgi:chromosome segregation protein
MFKIQRLEITGFKSFADYTEVVFTGEGITAVVGPNGCGKSNISESISWVLGEQRAKQLRGTEMKDVIFQGSKNRPPSNMAEVVLHLVRDASVPTEEVDIEDIDSALEDIDDHSPILEIGGEEEAAVVESQNLQPATEESSSIEATLKEPSEVGNLIVSSPSEAPPDPTVSEPTQPKQKKRTKRHWRPAKLGLEFAPGEIVTVTRRLYRSGESEYLLNGRECRLRDIQDLFSGTGLSGTHYAIVEQGRIGQILSAKPTDRRTLIEEAAGVTKFRVRQRAAEARLESARNNLSRVSDIISEIEKQVNSLRRQASKARRYQAAKEELRDLLRFVYTAEDRVLSKDLEEIARRLDELSSEERRLAETLTSREEESRQSTAQARAREDALTELRTIAAEAALQRDRRERESSYQREQIVALEKRLKDIENELDALHERATVVRTESQRLREQELQFRVEAEERAQTLLMAEESYSKRLEEVAKAETTIEEARADLLKHTAVVERLMELGRQLESTLERVVSQAEGLAREGERAAQAHEEYVAKVESIREEIEEAKEHLASLVSEREEAVRQLSEAREDLTDAIQELETARNEFSRVHHRLDTLSELDLRRTHYSQPVQRLLTVASGEKREFHCIGTLADLLRVESQWERVVEGVLGPYLQAVVVPTPEDATRAALWLKTNKAGSANFIIAGLHGSSSDSASSLATEDPTEELTGLKDVSLDELLGVSPEMLSVLRRVLPREMRARIATDLDQAMALSLRDGSMYVTLDGDWVIGGEFLNGGSARVLEDGEGLLAFKRELRELNERSVSVKDELTKAEERVAIAKSRVSEAETSVASIRDLISREEREQITREMNAKQLAQEVDRAARHMRVVADDAARLAVEQQELEAKRAKALHDAELAESARQSTLEIVNQAATILADARREAEIENGRLSEQRAIAAAANERRRAAASELRRIEAESNDLTARIERYTRESEEASERLSNLRNSLGELEQGTGNVEEEKARLEREIGESTELLNQARSRADALAAEVAELNKQVVATRDQRATLEVQRAERAARYTYISESCMTDLGQSLEEISNSTQLDETFELETAHEKATELRSKIEAFGAVNMMALEELSEAEERFNFLTTQRQDINDGIASTEEALREIKRRSRERFLHAFEVINHNFGELFIELFGGGQGGLSLIDAEDVLESGIDIDAQPPGKRLQNVLLLSGGEKAMAALALVLAIFRYRPSPFCLLDEVDAPLDEANVGRFTSKIVEMSANTQFIVITHNKRTMEAARALYGVTMEEAGISKVVSVKFE